MTPLLTEAVQVAIWTGPVVAGIGVVGAVIGTWRRTNDRMSTLEQSLATVIAQTRKVGNGFVDASLGGQRRIEDGIAELRKDIGGLRAELRDERRAREEADARIEEHQAYERTRLDDLAGRWPRPGGLP